MNVLLDSYPLSMLAHPRPDIYIAQWAEASQASGHIIYIPEVIDYEIRRELLRANKIKGVSNLDLLKLTFNFLPITSEAMLLAAELWS